MRSSTVELFVAEGAQVVIAARWGDHRWSWSALFGKQGWSDPYDQGVGHSVGRVWGARQLHFPWSDCHSHLLGRTPYPVSRRKQAPRPTAYQDFDDILPIHRAGTTNDIAYGALYLASDESRHTTGYNLMIDAGITVRMALSSKLVKEIDVRNKQIAGE